MLIGKHGRCLYTSQPIRVVEPQWHKNIELRANTYYTIAGAGNIRQTRDEVETLSCKATIQEHATCSAKTCENASRANAQLGFPWAKAAVRFVSRRRLISVGHDRNPTKEMIGETKAQIR